MNTKEIIIQAMFRLMQKYSHKNIITQMIIDEAKVSRSTFYRHYRNKYDLVNDYYKSHVGRLVETYPTWSECNVEIFRFMSHNQPFFRKTLDIGGPDSFWEFLYNYSYEYSKRCFLKFSNQKDLAVEDQLGIEFYVSGSIFIMKQWIRNGSKIEPDKMAEWSYKLIPDKFKQSLNP
jgi:AcrR family transcriptional regulator